MVERRSAWAVVTGGGTAGHVLPALAIADGLVRRGRAPDDIHYVGTTRGVEVTLLADTPYPRTLLDVVGLQRRLTRRNLAFLPRLVRSVRAASRLMAELSPAVVINVGGYASFPMSFVAKRHGVPLVVVSYDQRPGLVSRLLARRAAVCAVAFADSPLPGAVHTGAPVRTDLIEMDRAAARDDARLRLGLPTDRFVIAVMCGSLGAKAINAAVTELVDQWAERRDVAVYHVVGERFVHEAAPERDGTDGILYKVKGYETDMAAVYAAADVMMTRAGAGTIAELATVGVPAVVVPWPGAADNHQLANAKTLSDHGGAVLVEQHDLTVASLRQTMSEFIADPDKLATVATAARDCGEVHRSGALLDVIERAARR